MKRNRLPLILAGTATVLASFGITAQAASAASVARGQTWLGQTWLSPVAQGQTWLSPSVEANKWFAIPLAGHSLFAGLIHLPGYGTAPVMPPLF